MVAPLMPGDATVSARENQTAVGTFTAISGTSPITYTLSGSDASLFSIDSNTAVVAFLSAPDLEIPGDDNVDNSYEITITATNADGSDYQDISVVVLDIVEGAAVDHQPIDARIYAMPASEDGEPNTLYVNNTNLIVVTDIFNPITLLDLDIDSVSVCIKRDGVIIYGPYPAVYSDGNWLFTINQVLTLIHGESLIVETDIDLVDGSKGFWSSSFIAETRE